jgi:F0F1-type ATP synthase assembly protein I
MSPSSRPSPKENPKDFMRFYSLAFELVVMNVSLILGGYFLDRYLNSSPAFILIGVFLSMAGTIWLLLRSLK